ncbi:hypothetical protein HYH02_011367 [Chlamydomonas schloesseri]|uniref:Uncharacterized protein n=1 Tax=Chlamydomonas schloesseri TaxID=2026947 RepID=A0A835W661_9CHLO|nr:hypothetical protein HYH02_011367 [Chlamydomonas schloesseri]|eukprot:KAG2437111.1 hypothetical protein HYH02_011367 [Chlamydomonas schloesseri]
MQKSFPCLGESSKRSAMPQVSKSLALVVLAVASLACLQGLRWLSQGYASADAAIQASAANAVYTPAEAQFLGRNYRQRLLNAQLRDKDLEVKYLRAQLESAIEASKIKDDSIRAAEQVISELREREETAKIGRSKAQLALAAKASALQTCQYQTETLLAEVTQCGKALRRL